jgi:hypothetical protein
MPRPKSKSQADPESLKEDINANHKRQYSDISSDNYRTKFPYDHYCRSGLDYMMDGDDKNSKCIVYTH